MFPYLVFLQSFSRNIISAERIFFSPEKKKCILLCGYVSNSAQLWLVEYMGKHNNLYYSVSIIWWCVFLLLQNDLSFSLLFSQLIQCKKQKFFECVYYYYFYYFYYYYYYYYYYWNMESVGFGT